MFYYMYQITNLVNNKIYVGVHKTHDINDGYMGSGKIIKRAIEKYGIGNFRKDILETFESAKDMYAREKELVTEEFLLREDVYNLRRGGSGGFDYINKNLLYGFSNTEVAKKGRKTTDELMQKLYGDNWRNIIAKKGGESASAPESKEKSKQTKIKNGSWAKTEHMNSIDAITKKKNTFSKISHQQGDKNSQFGTMWVTNGETNLKIRREEIDKYQNLGYYKGRVTKNGRLP